MEKQAEALEKVVEFCGTERVGTLCQAVWSMLVDCYNVKVFK